MTNALRQNVIVQSGGVIEIRSPELLPGTREDEIAAEIAAYRANRSQKLSSTPTCWYRLRSKIKIRLTHVRVL